VAFERSRCLDDRRQSGVGGPELPNRCRYSSMSRMPNRAASGASVKVADPRRTRMRHLRTFARVRRKDPAGTFRGCRAGNFTLSCEPRVRSGRPDFAHGSLKSMVPLNRPPGQLPSTGGPHAFGERRRVQNCRRPGMAARVGDYLPPALRRTAYRGPDSVVPAVTGLRRDGLPIVRTVGRLAFPERRPSGQRRPGPGGIRACVDGPGRWSSSPTNCREYVDGTRAK